MSWLHKGVRKWVNGLAFKFSDDTRFYFNALSLISKQKDLVSDRTESLLSAQYLQGIWNHRIIPFYPGRLWPYWVNKQVASKEREAAVSNTPFTFLNQLYREWTLLSAPAVDAQVAVDPKGAITPTLRGWSLETWLAKGNKRVSLSKLKSVKQHFDAETGALHSVSVLDQLELRTTSLFSPDPTFKHPFLAYQVTLKNTGYSPISISLFFAIRPYNSEGLSAIHDIVYLSSGAFVVNNQLGLVLDKKPDNIACGDFQNGDTADYIGRWEMILQTRCETGLASAFAEYRITLYPNQEQTFSCKTPSLPQPSLIGLFRNRLSSPKFNLLTRRIRQLQNASLSTLFEQAVSYRTPFSEAVSNTHISNPRSASLIRESLSHVLNFIGKKELTSGFSALAASDIRTALPLLRALQSYGHPLYSASWLRPFFPKSRFKTWFSKKHKMARHAGYRLYALHLAASRSQNDVFRNQCISTVLHFVKTVQSYFTSREIIGLRQYHSKTTTYDAQELFLVEYQWFLGGLKLFISLTDALGRIQDKERFQHYFNLAWHHYDSLLSESIKHTRKSPYIPVIPTTTIDSRLSCALQSVYPLRLFDPFDERVTNTLALIEKMILVDGVVFDQTHKMGFDILATVTLGHVYLLRQDPKAWAVLDWLESHATATGCFSEALHPISDSGCFGEGHFGPACAAYLNLIRHFVVSESEKELHLCPMIPPKWLESDGTVFSVKNAYTSFGMLTIKLEKTSTTLKLTLQCEFTKLPSRVKLSFPLPVQSLSIDGIQKDASQSFVCLPHHAKSVNMTLADVRVPVYSD